VWRLPGRRAQEPEAVAVQRFAAHRKLPVAGRDGGGTSIVQPDGVVREYRAAGVTLGAIEQDLFWLWLGG